MESKWQQVSLGLLAVNNNFVVSKIPILRLISNFTGLFSKSLETVPSAPTIIIIIIIIIILLPVKFSLQHWLEAFHWSLSDSISPLVSVTLLSILADIEFFYCRCCVYKGKNER